MGRRLLLLVPALLLAGVLCRGAGPKTFTWSLDGMRVEGRGDSLYVALTWTFSDWNIPAAKAMVFSPALRNGEKVATLTPVSVYGRKAATATPHMVASGNRSEVAVLNVMQPVRITVEDLIPRSEWMDTVKVSLTVSEWSKHDGLVLRSTSQRAVFYRPPAPDDPEFPWDVLEPEERPEMFIDLSFRAPLHFDGASVKFDPYFNGNREALEPFIAKVESFGSSSTFAVRSSSLVLTVPPQGVQKESVKLSRSRVASVYDYLRKTGLFQKNTPERIGGGEDWDGVSKWVMGTKYKGDERLMEILSWEGTTDAKAGALRREKTFVWDILREQCFPALGYVEYNVSFRQPTFNIPGFVRSVYDTVPEALGPRDFWYLATESETGSPEWLEIICTGADLNPYDTALNLDAAFGLMDEGSVDAAAPYLRNAEGDPRAQYAFASWLYRKGRYDECIARLEAIRQRTRQQEAILQAVAARWRWETYNVAWERYYP